MSKLYYILSSIIFFYSCSPVISTVIEHKQDKIHNNEIIILNEEQKTQDDITFIGNFEASENRFFPNCDYSFILGKMRMAASLNGANIVDITHFKSSQMILSPCYKVTANLLRTDNLSRYKKMYYQDNDSVLSHGYALIHIYRFDATGLLGYDLYFDDDLIDNIKRSYKKTIKTNKFGNHIIWAKTERKESLTIDIQPGNEYYIRCDTKIGLLLGRPEIDFVDNNIGKFEYNSFIVKHN